MSSFEPESGAYGTFSQDPQNQEEIPSDCEIIIQNIDGTYSKATPASKYELKENEKAKKENKSQKIRYIVDEEEIRIYSNLRGIPQNVDEFLDLYLRHQRYFTIFLMIMILVDLFFGIEDFTLKKESLAKMMILYKEMKFTSLEWFLNSMLIGESLCSIAYYSLGVLALSKKSVNLFKAFAVFAVVGLLFQMMMAYLDKFNVLIFLMRFFGLFYSRFLCQLLMSLLLVPQYSSS